jgi:predicted O-linked N-acetylglucosamine transferase (SPINDLY family)
MFEFHPAASILMFMGRNEEGIVALERALAQNTNQHLLKGFALCNYIEALRLTNKLDEARNIGYRFLKHVRFRHKEDQASLFNNLGKVELQLGNRGLAIDRFSDCVNALSSRSDCWRRLLESLINDNQLELAHKVALKGINLFPNDGLLFHLYGVVLHSEKKVEEALHVYRYAATLSPGLYIIRSSIAAALQGLGLADQAMEVYADLLNDPNGIRDAGLLNNFGALLGTMNRHEEEIYWLSQALRLDNSQEQAMTNIAGFLQDEGLLDDAHNLLNKLLKFRGFRVSQSVLIELRKVVMMSPISASFEQMMFERNEIMNGLRSIVQKYSNVHPKTEIENSFDRIHFYVSFHGMNDRELQELVGQTYAALLSEPGIVLPSLESRLQKFLHLGKSIVHESINTVSVVNSTVSVSNTSDRIRIGFMSKFFGVFEPHGMLLDGTMKYLPRSQFTVVCLPIARTDGKPLAPTLLEACDELYPISLIHRHALGILETLNLDVLLFADLIGEPMNHFLAHSRIAPIQIAFWGNPITSGSPTMDYFISSEVMEHPYRTRFPSQQDAYSEQLIFAEGQGIWYFRPVDPEVEVARVNLTGRVAKPIPFSRRDLLCVSVAEQMQRIEEVEAMWQGSVNTTLSIFAAIDVDNEKRGLRYQCLTNSTGHEDAFIFILPQSVFKIHPLYDHVLAHILLRCERCHLVVTGGRRPLWTDLYRRRLHSIFEEYSRINNVSSLSTRFHIIERVSSESFYTLLSASDAVLHPFPFDGSRTSADAFLTHKPLITLPTEYLRGRMGYSLLRTMNLPELAARDIEEYINISVRLADDDVFYDEMVQKLQDRVDLIWEDLRFPYSVISFLQRLCGFEKISFEKFLSTTGRNVDEEVQRDNERQQNAKEFDEKFGNQHWMLNKNGVALLESTMDFVNNTLNSTQNRSVSWPRLFQYWKDSLASTGSTASTHWPDHPHFSQFTNSIKRGFDIVTYITEAVNRRREREMKNVAARQKINDADVKQLE